jgi:hypothetical protein
VIDDPTELLPSTLPEADLVLALGEVPGLGQLVPDIVRRAGARSVIVAIDHTSAVPPGLEAQLRQWLEQAGVAVVFPKPLCTLTETGSGVLRRAAAYDDPIIQRFAAVFGRPALRLTVEEGKVATAQVVRDSACGCARHVAENLPGTPLGEAVEKAGLLHHHFPCLATMAQDPDYGDTLMHVSGHVLRDAVHQELEPHLAPVAYVRPAGRVDDPEN